MTRAGLGRFLGVMGAVLLGSAPFTYVATGALGGVVWTKLVLGLVGVTFFLVTRPRRPTRRLHLSVLTSATGVVVVGVVIAINVVAYRADWVWDVSAGQVHSLSPQSLDVIARLSDPVEITAFYAPREPGARAATARLRLYAAESLLVRVETKNPQLHPELVQAYGVRADGPRVVIRCGGQVIRVEDASEQSLTNGLLDLVDPREETLHFLWGHGEADPSDEGPDGYQKLAAILKSEGYQIERLRLLDLEGTEIPERVKVLIVAGPRAAFLPDELEALGRYFDRGGRLVFLMEPSSPDLAPLLGPWGIEAGGSIVDPHRHLLGMGPSAPLVRTRRHVITEEVYGPVVMMTARALSVEPPAKILAEPLLETSGSARAGDALGPFLVGVIATVATEHPDPSRESTFGSPLGQVVVFGDTDWLNNRLGAQRTNVVVFLNTIAYLLGDRERITIRPRARPGTDLALGPGDLAMLKLFGLDLLPLLLVGCGFGIVWWRRGR